MTRYDTPGTVRSVGRAICILECLSQSSDGLTLIELSRKLGLPKSTVHDLIHTLKACGYLAQVPWSRRYRLGSVAFQFPQPREALLQAFCLPYVQALQQRLRLATQVAVRNGDEAVVITRIEPSTGLQCDRWPVHHGIHAAAIGKALIAWLPDHEIEALFPAGALPKFNENTIGSVQQLREHLALTRQRGYAVNDEEYTLGFRGVAAPIFGEDGPVVACVAAFGPVSEFAADRTSAVAKEVVGLANEISRQITAK